MPVVLFDEPKIEGGYKRVGTFNDCPVYTGQNPSKNAIAFPTDDNKGVCINQTAFLLLQESPDFNRFLENICERLLPECVPEPQRIIRGSIDLRGEVIRYLRNKKFWD